MKPKPQLLTVKQAAEYLGLNHNTLRTMLTRGRIRYSQDGPHGPIRIKQEWLDEYLERTSTPVVIEKKGHYEVDWGKH